MTDEEKLAFVQDIAEDILFSHVTDIEYLSVCEMTSDTVTYGSEEIQAAYVEDEHYENLIDAVSAKLDSALVGISWDGGNTWQY